MCSQDPSPSVNVTRSVRSGGPSEGTCPGRKSRLSKFARRCSREAFPRTLPTDCSVISQTTPRRPDHHQEPSSKFCSGLAGRSRNGPPNTLPNFAIECGKQFSQAFGTSGTPWRSASLAVAFLSTFDVDDEGSMQTPTTKTFQHRTDEKL